MPEEDTHIDGNGIAGVLTDAFGIDMTSVPRRCANCGQTNVLAAHRVYSGAGYVLRCPGCDGVAMQIGMFDDVLTLSARGVMTLPRTG